MISSIYFTQTIKYLGLPIDVYRRTWADIEHYAARHSAPACFGRLGIPGLEEEWIRYERE